MFQLFYASSTSCFSNITFNDTSSSSCIKSVTFVVSVVIVILLEIVAVTVLVLLVKEYDSVINVQDIIVCLR